MYTFKPEQLFSQRILSFRYSPQDARPLFRKCYIAVLTVLDALPEFDQSPTAAFLHQRVILFLTALPALLASRVPGLGPNGVLDAIKKNCQNFLEAKWSLLYHSALNLHARPRLPIPNEPEVPLCPPDEQLFRIVHQLVQAGSLSTAYQRLTEPGLCQIDPLPAF